MSILFSSCFLPREVRYVITFLNPRNARLWGPRTIRRQIWEICVLNAVCEGSLRKWVGKLNEGRQSVLGATRRSGPLHSHGQFGGRGDGAKTNSAKPALYNLWPCNTSPLKFWNHYFTEYLQLRHTGSTIVFTTDVEVGAQNRRYTFMGKLGQQIVLRKKEKQKSQVSKDLRWNIGYH